jgi:uncharacterized protein YeaO (DUF488 family)
LRKWFGHNEERWPDFQKHYLEELKAKKELAQSILEQANDRAVTLLFSAKDIQHNNAIVLKHFLEKFF